MQVFVPALVDNTLLIFPTIPDYAPLLATPASVLLHFRNLLLGINAMTGLAGAPQIHMPLNGLVPQLEAGFGLSILAKPGQDFALMDKAQEFQFILTQGISTP